MLLLQLRGITRINRLTATDAAKDAILACSGWVDDFQMFSNKMTCLRFEMPAPRAATLTSKLADSKITLDRECLNQAQDISKRDGDMWVTLQLTFLHDEPDLRRVVMSVPG